MSNCRELIEGFIYPHLEKFTDMVYRGGVDTEFMNVRPSEDTNYFTYGALACGACILFAHYKKIGDPRAEIAKERLCEFIRIASSYPCNTWGKLGILRGFNLLAQRGLISEIPASMVEAVKEKTNYEDFFDKETLKLRGKPTNYLHVAMACAGYRERLGWENDGYSSKISDILVNVLKDSKDGWMDDEIPYGRYDRYAMAVPSEFADLASDIGHPLPKIVQDNLRLCAKDMLFMANPTGDAILYGRSVACHGDACAPEIISSAFVYKLIAESDKDIALSYSYTVLKKMITYWYDAEMGSFNLWFNGRSANHYRSIKRVYEVNLDLAIHLFATLKNLEHAGLADTEITATIPENDKWESLTVDFLKAEDKERSLVILKRKGKLMLIPFVGTGKLYGRTVAYYPFPVMARTLEACATAEYPFMIPEYVDNDGNVYRPTDNFTNISVKNGDDAVTVVANGHLSCVNETAPKKTDIPFVHTITVCANKVTIKTECDWDFPMARTYYASADERVVIEPFGFDEVVSDAPEQDTNGIHHKLVGFLNCQTKNTRVLGAVITLPI